MTAPAIAIRVLTLTLGAFGVSAGMAAPIHADMLGNAFLNALTNAGISYGQPATAIALGRSVCPKVLAPGGTFEAVVAEMAQINGLSHDRAAGFTAVAIATYCPSLLSPLFPNKLQA